MQRHRSDYNSNKDGRNTVEMIRKPGEKAKRKWWKQKGNSKDRGEWQGSRGMAKVEGNGKGPGEWQGSRGMASVEGNGKGRG